MQTKVKVRSVNISIERDSFLLDFSPSVDPYRRVSSAQRDVSRQKDTSITRKKSHSDSPSHYIITPEKLSRKTTRKKILSAVPQLEDSTETWQETMDKIDQIPSKETPLIQIDALESAGKQPVLKLGEENRKSILTFEDSRISRTNLEKERRASRVITPRPPSQGHRTLIVTADNQLVEIKKPAETTPKFTSLDKIWLDATTSEDF